MKSKIIKTTINIKPTIRTKTTTTYYAKPTSSTKVTIKNWIRVLFTSSRAKVVNSKARLVLREYKVSRIILVGGGGVVLPRNLSTRVTTTTNLVLLNKVVSARIDNTIDNTISTHSHYLKGL